jgi:hypothetical protein
VLPLLSYHALGFDATMNHRGKSRRRRSYGTPRVTGREGLTEVRICRPADRLTLPYNEKSRTAPAMRGFKKIKDSEEDKARARLLAHFEDNSKCCMSASIFIGW